MKYRAVLVRTIVVSACFSLMPSLFADDINVTSLVTPCESCHGKDGVSQLTQIPSLAGLSSRYISDAIAAFRDNTRLCKDNIMCMLAKNISEQDAQRIGDYFAVKAFVAATQPFDQALANSGKQLHQRLCGKCHRNGGSTAEDDSGILSGQWKPYLEQQFNELKSGKRLMPEKMRPKIEQLSEGDRTALLEYYASNQR